MPTPDQFALAEQLHAAGLAPRGVDRYDGGFRYVLTGDLWEPWRDIGAVWHLVQRFRMHITCCTETPCVQGHCLHAVLKQDWHLSEQATDFADVPRTIARLALRLHAQQQEGG